MFVWSKPVSSNVVVAGANGDMTGLSSGVQANEHVVIEGQFNLTPGQRVTEAPAKQATASAAPESGPPPEPGIAATTPAPQQG